LSLGAFVLAVSPDRSINLPDSAFLANRDGEKLLEEVSELIGLQVYTNSGVFLGNINNLVVDVENGQVEGVFVGETNPLLVEGSKAVSVPYRWVQSVGDIVILKYFPKRVSLKKGVPAARASETKK